MSSREDAAVEYLLDTKPEVLIDRILRMSDRTVIPHDGGQREVYDADDRFQVVVAGRRWGKSKIGVKKMLKAARKPNQMVWWVAPTYKIVRRAYRETLRQLPPEVLAKPAPPDSADGRYILHFKNGTTVEFYSATNEDAMVGEGVDYVVVDEAALIVEHVWAQIIRPTLMDKGGGGFLISTPRGENWFYELWRRGQLGDAGYRSWRFVTVDNPYVDEKEIEEMERTMPAAIFEQEVLAQFISKSSSVLRLTDSNHQVQMADPKGVVVMGIDLAKHRDFTVIAAANMKDHRQCWNERFNQVSWPDQKRLIKEAVATLRHHGATHIKIMLDSTGLGDVIYDDLLEDGYDITPVNFTNMKQKMVNLLAADLDRNEAYWLDEEREEFLNYVYTIKASGRITYAAREGHHDDRVSARLLQHWGLINGAIPTVRLLEEEAPDESGSMTTFTLRSPNAAELLRQGF